MFERLDQFARTLPEPRFGDSWDAYYDQHVRNAERLRAEAFRCVVWDLGRVLRAAGRQLGARVGALRGRAGRGLTQADRTAGA